MNKSESKTKLVNSWRIDLTALFYVLTYFVTQFNLLKHGEQRLMKDLLIVETL